MLVAAPAAGAVFNAEAAVGHAQAAGKHCAAGEMEPALDALTALLETLEREYGAAHSSARVVRLNLAHVARALGRQPEARWLEVLPSPPGADAELAPELARGLRNLRSCAAARPRSTAGPLLSDLKEGDFEPHLAAARRFLQDGHYREALAAAELADRMAATAASPDARMRAAETLALARLQVGDRAGALAAARAAQQAAEAGEAVGSQITMARLLAQAGDLDGARAALEPLAAQATTAELRAELAEARGDLAILFGSPASAIELLSVALEGHQQRFGARHRSTAAVHQRLGDAHRMAGDLAAATASYGEVLEIRSEVLGSEHPEVARALNALGVLFADFGDWEEADASFAAAHAKLVKALGESHPEAVTVHTNRALARWGARPGDATAQAYAQAVDALALAMGADHPASSSALRNLARIEADRGNLDRAEKLLSRALAGQTAAFGAQHPAIATTRLERGRLQDRRGHAEAAALELAGAEAILTENYGDEHPLVARVRAAIARNAAGRGDDSVAWEQSREAARVLDLHVRRSFEAMPDRQRALLADDSADVVGALLSARGAPAAQVYRAMMPHRDSVLRSISASRAAARNQSERGRENLEKLAVLRERYASAALGETPELARRARALAREIDALEAIAALAGSGVQSRDPLEVMQAACTRLPADALLIEFVAYDASLSPGEPVPSYAAFALRGRDCSVSRVDLGPAAPIDEAAEHFGVAMREQRTDDEAARQALARLLLAPLEAIVSDVSRWLVVPDAALWGIPLGALPDAKTGGYLIERVTIGYLTSLYELAEPVSAGATAALDDVLIFGAPAFGESNEANGPVVLTASGPCRLPPFEPLPATEQEIAEIGEFLSSSRIVSGESATKARLRRELADRPGVLHLATHAYFAGLGKCEGEARHSSLWGDAGASAAANPLLLSGIVFAGANRGGTAGTDSGGILTAYEAAGLDLAGTRLVVLSACDTGTGLRSRGQEVQGLRWGFRASGASALVTSLWRSNDAATRRLMRSFYAALAKPTNGQPVDLFSGAAALRDAQLERVADDKRLGVARPLIWANFVFSGVL